MKQLWQKLENHLREHNPELLADLNPPATDAQVRELEKQIGQELSEEFVACLKVHDGQKGEADWLFGGHEFLSIEGIMMDWRTLNRLLEEGDFEEQSAKSDPEVGGHWWSPSWVPFTSNGGGDHFCLDLMPTSKGSLGQVIKYSGELPGRRLKAPSLYEWFELFVKTEVGC